MKITGSQPMHVLVEEALSRNVAITCKCGRRTIHHIPSFIFLAQNVGMCIIGLECPSCAQRYRLCMDEVQRCDKNFEVTTGTIFTVHPARGNENNKTMVDSIDTETLEQNWKQEN